jgi:hypothetical protein
MKMDIRKGRVVMACETDTDGNGDGDVHVDVGWWMVCVDINISANETEYMQLPNIHIFHVHPISHMTQELIFESR